VTDKSIRLIPTQDRVIVRRDRAETISPGGIHLPPGEMDRPIRGTVTHVGSKIPFPLDRGDSVIFGRYSGIEIDVEGEESGLLVMRADEIMVILRPHDQQLAPTTGEH